MFALFLTRWNRFSESSSRQGRGVSGKVRSLGQLFLLFSILAAIGFFSAILGMRLAVRGQVVEVPSLVGRSLEEAQKQLQALQLNLSVQGQRYDPQVPEGAVLSQYPNPGNRIKVQRSVQVVVSLGARQNPIPNLIGSPLRVARLMAEQNGYSLGPISEIGAPEGESQIVLQQYPSPQTLGVTSPKIQVLVTRKEMRRFVMPDLVGENLHQSVAALEKEGLRVSAIRYQYRPGVGRGTILKQFPEPGYPVTKESEIIVEVAR